MLTRTDVQSEMIHRATGSNNISSLSAYIRLFMIQRRPSTKQAGLSISAISL